MMVGDIATEANRLKQIAGQELKGVLVEKFISLVHEEVIIDFKVDQNFNHKGFSYNKQYLANFVIETLDHKFIIINSSSSYRHDRMKLQSYDVEGVVNNASISDRIIAAILLYPDKELDNKPLLNFRKSVDAKDAYSPASHILVVSELIQFLENHKNFVEEQKYREAAEEVKDENNYELNKIACEESVVSELNSPAYTSQIANNLKEIKDGSYYGLRGNAFEKEVVAELNNCEYLAQISSTGKSDSLIFNNIIIKICSDYCISPSDVINVCSSNTVLKLKSGGNAKTDIIVTLQIANKKITETISVKNTTKNRVSCHDYKSDDFIRVLGIEGTLLADYLTIYQQYGSHDSFISNLSNEFNLEEFIKLLDPYKGKLIEWALTGKHDNQNLIDPEKQVSNYLLMNKSGDIRFVDFSSYITELYEKSNKLVYGLPLSWTYPSKQRGLRIQLKIPIIL